MIQIPDYFDAPRPRSTATRDIEATQEKLIAHIAKLKTLYRSLDFTDEILDRELLDSGVGEYGDSYLARDLVGDAIEIYRELATIKSLIEPIKTEKND